MKIIFFNDKKLAQNLKEDKVTNPEKLFYLLFFLIGSELLGFIFTKTPKMFGGYKDNCINSCDTTFYWYLLLIPILSLLIKAYGIIVSYKINLTGDNKKFIERVMCLLFPIAIRMFLLLVFIKFLVSAVRELAVSFSSNLDISNIIAVADQIGIFIIAIYFYLRLKEGIKIASSTN